MSTLADLRATVDWYDAKIAKEDDEDRKTDLKTKRDDAEVKLQAAMEKVSQADIKPIASPSQGYSNTKAIEHELHSIPEFAGNNPTETESFIDRLSQAHTILVTQVDPSLEKTFIRCATLRLSRNVYKHLMNSKKTVDKFEDLKSFLQDHYAAKINAVQAMSKIFDIEFNEHMPYATYSTEITNAIKVGYRKVNAQFKEMNQGAQGDIDGESMALFFGGLMLANNIRTYNFDIFRDMLKDLDKVLNAEQIASSAEYYRHRTQSSQSSTFFGKPNQGNRKSTNQHNGKGKSGKVEDKDTKRDNGDKRDSRFERNDDRNVSNGQRNNGQPWWHGRKKKNRQGKAGNQNHSESKSVDKRENVTLKSNDARRTGEGNAFAVEPANHYSQNPNSVFESAHFH